MKYFWSRVRIDCVLVVRLAICGCHRVDISVDQSRCFYDEFFRDCVTGTIVSIENFDMYVSRVGAVREVRADVRTDVHDIQFVCW